MKFFIVGASGFIGRRALAQARDLGLTTVGTRASSNDESLTRFDLRHDRITDCIAKSFFSGDDLICALISAGISRIDDCRRNSAETRLLNVDKTIQLLDDLAELKAKPIFLSTSCAFDGGSGCYTEDSQTSPINEYGRQKVEVENYLRSHHPNALILRLDKVVGDDPVDAHLFSEWYDRMNRRAPITCIAGQVLSPTLVDDVARAVLVACQQQMSGIYHVANPEFVAREQLAREFASACGYDAEIVTKPMEEFGFADPRPLKTYLDGSKFIRETGMRYTPMSDAIRVFLQKSRGHDPRDDAGRASR